MDEKLIDGLVEDITSNKLEAYELVNNYLSLQQKAEELENNLNGMLYIHNMQAERIKMLKQETGHNFEVNRKLEEENKRYKEALEKARSAISFKDLKENRLIRIKGIIDEALKGESK